MTRALPVGAPLTVLAALLLGEADRFVPPWLSPVGGPKHAKAPVVELVPSESVAVGSVCCEVQARHFLPFCLSSVGSVLAVVRIGGRAINVQDL